MRIPAVWKRTRALLHIVIVVVSISLCACLPMLCLLRSPLRSPGPTPSSSDSLFVACLCIWTGAGTCVPRRAASVAPRRLERRALYYRRSRRCRVPRETSSGGLSFSVSAWNEEGRDGERWKGSERCESGILRSSAGLDGREYGYYRRVAF